jgi:RecJ-like exonuclease
MRATTKVLAGISVVVMMNGCDWLKPETQLVYVTNTVSAGIEYVTNTVYVTNTIVTSAPLNTEPPMKATGVMGTAPANNPAIVVDLDRPVKCPVCKGLRNLRVTRSYPCQICSGTGVVAGRSPPTCVNCRGLGKTQALGTVPCLICNGEGQLPKSAIGNIVTCLPCSGKGTVTAQAASICKTCGGKGRIQSGMAVTTYDSDYYYYYDSFGNRRYRARNSGPPITTYKDLGPCAHCSGTGQAATAVALPCENCSGVGRTLKTP